MYENEEGEYCFQFNDVIESVAKMYLEKKFRYVIQEKILIRWKWNMQVNWKQVAKWKLTKFILYQSSLKRMEKENLSEQV